MSTRAERYPLAPAMPDEHRQRAAVAPTANLPLHMVVLAVLTAIGPVSFQVFLPALPAIQAGLDASPGTAQLALSLSMLGIAVANLVYGPLSDRVGRRPTLLAGMVVLAAGSLMCAFATEISSLIAGRILQAAGGASGMVVTRAIVMDAYGREGARGVLGRLMTAMVIAPMLATPVGGLLVDQLGWRANFLVVALCALIVLVVIWRALPETRHEAIQPGPVAAGFARLLRLPAFTGYALQSGFGMAALLAFTTASPAYFAQRLAVGGTGFGLLLMIVTSGFLVGSVGAGRLSARLTLDQVVLLGSLTALTASGAALGMALAGVWTIWALVLPAMLLAATLGFAMPSAQAGAVAAMPELAGTASGLAGFVVTVLGAAATQIVGNLYDGTPYPIAGVMTLASTLAVGAALLARRGRLSQTDQGGPEQ
jgi:MFS transporter, DHA1 family, multidrug resistance protein